MSHEAKFLKAGSVEGVVDQCLVVDMKSNLEL